MRVLFLSHYSLPHVGGIETAIDGLARQLVRRGHDVVHLASAASRRDEADTTPAEGGARAIRVPALNTLEDRLEVPWPLFSPKLAGVLREEVPRAEVVHAHGFLSMAPLAGLLYAKRRGGSVRVLTEHVGHVAYESELLNRVQAAAIASLGQLATRAAQALVVLNDKVEGELRGIAPEARIERIANGVDLSAYRPADPGERTRLRERLGWDERPRVLFVGRLVRKKGVDVALAAARRGGFQLVVAGPGKLDEAPPHNVELLGARAQAEVAELYRAADAFLLPSRGEGFPITIQEAMASGLPVIVSDDPSYASYFEGAGRGAALVEPEAGRVAAAVSGMLERLPAAREAALRHARAEFSWERAATEHERLYASLA